MADIRKVENYVKDFRNGNITETAKYKPTDSQVRGKAKIEVFDSQTGQKIIEAKTENCINDIISKRAYYDYFKERICDHNSSAQNNYKYKSDFEYILLTDSNEPERSDGNIIKGNLLGYAYKRQPYSGDSSTKGTINNAETKIEYFEDHIKMHYVFDFPTHSANGTFQSIWWSDYTSPYYSMDVYNLEESIYKLNEQWNGYYDNSIASYNSENDKTVIIIGDSRYTNYISGTKKMYIIDHATKEITELQSSELNFSSSNRYIFNDKDHIWLWDGRNRYAKIDLRDNSYQLYCINYEIRNGYLIGIIGNDFYSYNRTEGKIYIKTVTNEKQKNDQGEETEWNIYVDKDIRENITFINTSEHGQFIFPVKNNNFVIATSSHSYCWLYDYNFNKIRPIHRAYTTNGICYDIDNFNGKFGFAYTTYINENNISKVIMKYGKKCIGTQYGACTLLSKPITKTSLNTMKITYDFIIDRVNPYSNI